MSADTFFKYGVYVFDPYKKASQKAQLGNFKIYAFRVPHDNTECRGFLIEHKDIGKLLYMTDLEYCPYNFKKHEINHMLIEANYSKEYVSEESNHREHVLRGHCEITQTLGIIEANKTDALKTVILCHISAESGSPVEFVEQAQKVAGNGITVDFADAGKQWELTNGDKCPFM